LLLNAVEHGGHFDPEKTVELSCIRTARGIVCYIRDPGEGFAPENMEGSTAIAPDQIFAHLDRRAESGLRPGGLGLFLVKQVADELLYNAKGNEVVLTKYLSGAGVDRCGGAPTLVDAGGDGSRHRAGDFMPEYFGFRSASIRRFPRPALLPSTQEFQPLIADRAE
jgi:anti-sigma regulatory factor (Ser/Thr protein kinase)